MQLSLNLKANYSRTVKSQLCSNSKCSSNFSSSCSNNNNNNNSSKVLINISSSCSNQKAQRGPTKKQTHKSNSQVLKKATFIQNQSPKTQSTKLPERIPFLQYVMKHIHSSNQMTSQQILVFRVLSWCLAEQEECLLTITSRYMVSCMFYVIYLLTNIHFSDLMKRLRTLSFLKI